MTLSVDRGVEKWSVTLSFTTATDPFPESLKSNSIICHPLIIHNFTLMVLFLVQILCFIAIIVLVYFQTSFILKTGESGGGMYAIGIFFFFSIFICV